jgi:hypothetical protein
LYKTERNSAQTTSLQDNFEEERIGGDPPDGGTAEKHFPSQVFQKYFASESSSWTSDTKERRQN